MASTLQLRLLLVCVALASVTVLARRLEQAPEYTEEVEAGLEALRALAEENKAGVVALRDAIAEGDLEAARRAYELSRPAYEQIEVLAISFPNIDSDIDARAYAFPNGEAVEGAADVVERGVHFQGFHRIEALIFRNMNLTAALPFAEDLVKDSEDLIVALSDSSGFSAAGSFAGMIGLATEVGAKKMSSEEETYSDLSVLIYHNNYLGVKSQYTPFAEALQAVDDGIANDVDIALSEWAAALMPLLQEEADGTYTYTPYSQVSIPERSSIQAGAYAVAAALRRAQEALGIDSVEEEEENELCEEEPQKVYAGDSDEIAAGLDYFRALMPFQKSLVQDLLEAIESDDLDAAKLAYTRSRPPYEQIEVLAVAFEQEDSDIDARPYSFELGEFDEGFKGFHKLERQIYRDGDLGEDTVAAAQELLEVMDRLAEKLDDSELFNSVVSFEGIIGVATEVPAKKISSEEEVFSLLSHLIYYNNWKGIYSQIKPFLALLDDDTLVSEVDTTFDKAFKCLPVMTKDVWNQVSATDVTQSFVDALADADYPEYDLTEMETRECIIKESYEVRDIILRLSDNLGIFADCHEFHKNSVFNYRHTVIS